MIRTERSVQYVDYALTPAEVKEAIKQYVGNNKTETKVQGFVGEHFTIDILGNHSAVLTNIYK